MPKLNEKKDSISACTVNQTIHSLTALSPFLPVFQQIDVEQSTDAGTGAICLRLYGVTEVRLILLPRPVKFMIVFQAGNSILAIVTDFLPYFYIAVPRGFGQDDLESFRFDLNVSRNILM
jgi:hypothetical protein